jgi:uncharacterized protein YdhG (YjbR/CyaY superfamily)
MPPKTVSSESANAEVEAYFARLSDPARAKLEELRTILRAAAPKEATERLSYSIPSFHYLGALVSYAAFKNHISFFPMGSAAIEEFAEELKGFRVSKGTVHFPLDKPFPAALIKRMVKSCVARNKARAPKKG